MSEGRHLVGLKRDLEVFETPDPPPNPFTYEDDSQSSTVHPLETDVKSSYDKFKDTSLDAKSSDFSDRLNRPWQHGFKATPSEYELLQSTQEPETLMDRYQRLKQEVVDLVSDVEKIKESQKSSEKLLEVSPVDLAQDVQQLQRQLHDLQMDQLLGTGHLTSPEHPYHSLLLRDLKAQIQAMGSEGTAASGSHSNQPVYELYSRTEAAKFSHISKLSEVEERLAQLEKMVGNTDTNVSSVAAGLDTDQTDLSTSVLSLQAKVALLDSAHVNAVGTQLQDVVALLDKVEKKAETQDTDPDLQSKVSEAIEAVSVIQTIAPLVPDLIARLHTLQELHERAAQFASSVSLMADNQEQLSQQTSHLHTLLSRMQTSFHENMSLIQTNLASLDSRLTALPSRP